ncbi:MAG: hypothetical protein JWP27_766 [Flaviaesturariibacter sp.]|nr:hypothetical protein [Flaviaesturariibacter sp.]
MKDNEKKEQPATASTATGQTGKVDVAGAAPTDTPGEKSGEGDRTDVPDMDHVNGGKDR